MAIQKTTITALRFQSKTLAKQCILGIQYNMFYGAIVGASAAYDLICV